MAHIEDGGPAFPTLPSTPEGEKGMSLRDFFAAHTLNNFSPHSAWNQRPIVCARRAYKIADAMLIVRELDLSE